MDRASDYGSEGWGFESLRARSGPPRCDPPVGVLHFYEALLRECFFHAHPLVVVPAGRFPVRSEMTAARQWGVPEWWCDRTRPARSVPQLFREKVRPAQPLQRCFREKTRPARHKPPILGHFSCAGRTFSRSRPPSDRAGRTFSRTGHSDVGALKPTAPLRPLMQATVKPTSPLLAPEQQPLKPPSPLRPKNAPKTPISRPQRRWRFQPHTDTSEQRRRRFHARDFCCTRAMACPDRHTFACNFATDTSRVSMQSLKFRAFHRSADRRRQGIACEIGEAGVEDAGAPGCGARGW